MPKSRPSRLASPSADARQLGRYGVLSVAIADIARDSPMSPESEDSFSLAGEDSPGSQHSFGIDTEILPEDQADSVIDVPASPDDQDDFGIEADMSSEDGSTSAQSQYSFGISSMPLLEPQADQALPVARIPTVQYEETELPLSQLAATLGVGAPSPVVQECDVSAPPV
jgi:hypothetical protein